MIQDEPPRSRIQTGQSSDHHPGAGTARQRGGIDLDLFRVPARHDTWHHAGIDRDGAVEYHRQAGLGKRIQGEASQHVHVRIAAPDQDQVAHRFHSLVSGASPAAA